MSDNEEILDGNNANAGGALDEASPEDLKQIIKDLRRENASKRVVNKENDAKLAEFDEWKRQQMTEVERLKADADEARKEVVSTWQEYYVNKYNVPEARREFVRGSTKDEIEKAAKALGDSKEEKKESDSGNSDTSSDKKTFPDLFPGSRGKPVGSESAGAVDFDTLLRQQLRK